MINLRIIKKLSNKFVQIIKDEAPAVSNELEDIKEMTSTVWNENPPSNPPTSSNEEVEKMLEIALKENNGAVSKLLTEKWYGHPLVRQHAQQLLDNILKSIPISEIIYDSNLKKLIDLAIHFFGIIDPTPLEEIIISAINEMAIAKYFNTVPGANINKYLNKLFSIIDGQLKLRLLSNYGIEHFFRVIVHIKNIDINALDTFILNNNNISINEVYYYIKARNFEPDYERCLNRFISGKSANSDEELSKYIINLFKIKSIDLVSEMISKVDWHNIYSLNLDWQIRQLILENYTFSNEIIDKLFDLKYIDIYLITDIIYILNKCLNSNEFIYAGQVGKQFMYSKDNFTPEFINLFTKVVVENKDEYLATFFLERCHSNPNFNFPAIQAIIEKYGGSHFLSEIVESDYLQKFKFSPFKKKFNEKFETFIGRDGGVENYIKAKKAIFIEIPPIRAIENLTNKRIILTILNIGAPSEQNIFNEKLFNEKPQKKEDFEYEDYFLGNTYFTNYDKYIEEFNKLKNFSTAYAKDKKDAEDFVNYILDKKDWFCISTDYVKNIFGNIFILLYKRGKNKTYIDLYHEAFKNDYAVVKRAFALLDRIYYQIAEFGNLEHNKIIDKIIAQSTNFAEYVKLLEKMCSAIVEMHDSGYKADIMEPAILNKGFDINDPTNEELLFILDNANIAGDSDNSNMEHYLDKINNINSAGRRELINTAKFIHNWNLILPIIYRFNRKEKISWKREMPEYNALKEFHTDLSLIEDFEAISEHIQNAEPKNEKLKKFNLTLPNGFEFKVLKYLDPYTFKVGADTDCCQRVGGAGEEAAIDSFINPLAGVLILTKDNSLISQSYFHYVPEQNGLILDNVEEAQKNMKHLGLNQLHLSKLYADYAVAIKNKNPDITYIKCGIGYNKLDNSLFSKTKMEEDPRNFAVDDPYSDFDENEHLDLLKPDKMLSTVSVGDKHSVKASKIQPLIKTAVIRRMLLNSFLKNN